jgi:hypothetical protein
MTDFLTGADLASYLDEPLDGAIDNIVTRTNALVTQEWANPTTIVPEWVKNIAWDVAIRAAANPKGVTTPARSICMNIPLWSTPAGYPRDDPWY